MKPEPEANPWQWLVGLPAISENVHAPQAAFGLACLLMNELSAGKIVRLDAVEAAVKRLEIEFRPLAPGGMNTLHFLQAAHEMEIPWRHVANNVYQFGWGALSRWLDSSFTDETSTISAGLARDNHRPELSTAPWEVHSPSPNIPTIWLSVNFDFLIPHLQRIGSLYFQLVHHQGELTRPHSSLGRIPSAQFAQQHRSNSNAAANTNHQVLE